MLNRASAHISMELRATRASKPAQIVSRRLVMDESVRFIEKSVTFRATQGESIKLSAASVLPMVLLVRRPLRLKILISRELFLRHG
jgi:hypothetical protein